MRHTERLFVAPLQQTSLSGLCIPGCIVGMCLRRCSFKAKHKADFLFRMRHSSCLTATHTHTHTHTHTYETTPTELEMQVLTWGKQVWLWHLPLLCCCCRFYRTDPVGLSGETDLCVHQQADFNFIYRMSMKWEAGLYIEDCLLLIASFLYFWARDDKIIAALTLETGGKQLAWFYPKPNMYTNNSQADNLYQGKLKCLDIHLFAWLRRVNMWLELTAKEKTIKKKQKETAKLGLSKGYKIHR